MELGAFAVGLMWHDAGGTKSVALSLPAFAETALLMSIAGTGYGRMR